MTSIPSRSLPMVDLYGQFQEIETEIMDGIMEVIKGSSFINGTIVHEFSNELENYLEVKKIIPCGNGTDALQIALMALDLRPGDEVIVPAFSYVAAVEVIALLQLKPVFVDVDASTFNMDPQKLEEKVNSHTKAVIVVHLFGQSANMEQIMNICDMHDIPVIEDNAQSLGAKYMLPNGVQCAAGAIGKIGTTSFFPSKILGAYGDGGALILQDEALAEKVRMIASHGQKVKYHHEIIGVNSRLDTLQAAILKVKLKRLSSFIEKRQAAAHHYDEELEGVEGLRIPKREQHSTHVFHQYTLKIAKGRREEFQKYLGERGVPTMVYYPVPLHLQKAYHYCGGKTGDFPISETLCQEVVSLPMHTQMTEQDVSYICNQIKTFFHER